MAGEQKMSDLGLKASLSRLGIRTRGRGSTGSSLTRLNSLKPARDLTLGSTPKRTFVPNLPARRVLKEEPENEKKEAGPSKDRSEKLSRRDQTRPRGRGRGRGDLITSHSIFSQGPFAVSSSVGTAVSASSQSSNRKSGSRETRSHASIITEGAGELEYDEESKKVLERLDASGKIDITADELQHGGLVPITIPLADPKLFGQRLEDAAQEKASFEAASMHNKVKHEPNDDIDMAYSDDISSPRVAAKTKRQLHCHELFSSSNAEERLLFMQFPDVLPIKPLSHEDNMPNDNEDSPKSSLISKSEEERQNFSFNNVSEGCIGKLVIHKSGRVRMLLGNTSLHVEMGTPCGFLQDLVAIHLEEDRKEMICLGHIDHRIICVPDYEELIGSAGS